jgi:hypothetical protein
MSESSSTTNPYVLATRFANGSCEYASDSTATLPLSP